jgi:hypothetical protein
MSERATLDEAALAGLPSRVQALARNLALSNPAAARSYVEGQQRQANAEGRARPNETMAHKPAEPQPRGARARAGTTELAAKAIKLTIVLDAAAVAAIAVPDGGRPRIVVSAAGRRLTAELNPKTLRKTIATIREHGPVQVAVMLQGKLAAGDVIEEGAITAQVKTPKPVPADGAKPLPMETVIQAIERLDTEQAGGEHG